MIRFKNIRLFAALIFVGAMAVSCSQDEGPGGTAEIIGRVWVQNYNADYSILNDEYWAEEADVYLIYGTDSIYSDRFKTNYDGSYRFQYLHQGEYTIYVYSKDNTFESASGRVPIMEKVTVEGGDEVVEVPIITIFE